MKKQIFSLLLMAAPVVMFAQLKVKSNGNLQIREATTPETGNTNHAMVAASDDDECSWSDYIYYKYGLHMNIKPVTSVDNAAIYGDVSGGNNSTNTFSAGVWGYGAGSTRQNFGVIGGIGGYGAGVYGTTGWTPDEDLQFIGRYAGYFDGPAYFSSNTTAYAIYNLSDMRLKENVISLSEKEKSEGGVLDNIQKLDILTYNLKGKTTSKTPKNKSGYIAPDEDKVEKTRWHYGVSAQELQRIYPDLVLEGQDGYLAVNYTELVPILIRSIQELKQEVDELKGESASRASDKMFTDEDAVTKSDSNSQSLRSTASLKQNTPNPFSERTVISFTLPEDAKNANICIFDMSGKMLKQLPVTPAMQSVTINGYELAAGMYIYSLVIGGKEIESKRMILSK